MEQKPYTVYSAKTNFRGSDRVFGIKMADRRQHMYVIGKTGTGKTNLLKSVALQDIQNGSGVAIVDPHGEFVQEVLARIPKNRAEDVVYFNPVDTDNPVGFNVLEVTDPQYKHLVASDLMGIFTKIWANVWSARMEYILSNCILALLDTPGTTLLGIPRILIDKDYRRRIIDNVKDPVVRSFWIHEYENYTDRLRSEAIVPIQNKVGQFLSTPLIRNIVGQEKSAINIPEIINTRKILLVDVSKGRIGEDNSALLGAMVITKIQLAAMERVRIPEAERKDFYLYVDEFQNFATESFASILSEARKYRLNIIVAHQYVGQLVTETSTKVRDAIFGNVGTMITFRIGATDAEFLEAEFTPEFDIQDLVNLPNFHVYLKLMVNGVTSRPFSAVTIPFDDRKDSDSVFAEIGAVIDSSRKHYSRPRGDVEEAISRWSGSGSIEVNSSSSKTGKEILANCWICGKETQLNFKPDGRRPIYCVSCRKKVESGEIAPAASRATPKGERQQYGASLGDLGIEFEDRGSYQATKNSYPPVSPKPIGFPHEVSSGLQRNEQANQRRDFPVIGQGIPIPRRPVYRRIQETRPPLSLKDLPKRYIAKDPPKRVQDVEGLRTLLKETLSPKDSREANQSEKTKDKDTFSTKLKPGESVKF